MTSSLTSTRPMLRPAAIARTGKRTDATRVMHHLDEYCASLQPGHQIPTHTELMRRFNASERAVIRALEELQRAGKIVRRQGAGTFVTDAYGADKSAAPVVLANSCTVVAIARPDHSFFDRCMNLLFQHAELAGLSLICRLIDPRTAPTLVAPPEAQRPLGFIVFSYQLAPLAGQLQDSGCRAVVVGTPPVGVTPVVPCVQGDQEHGGYLATRHLLDLGHRRIALCSHAPVEQGFRWLGHQRAVADARRESVEIEATTLSIDEVTTWKTDPNLAAAYFSRPDAPTGIAVWNDHEATALLAVLTRAGVKVPEQVSLVGYDALPEGQRVHPALTTVDPATDRQLQAALGLLTRPVPQPSSGGVMVVPSVLVVPALLAGASSAPPSLAA